MLSRGADTDGLDRVPARQLIAIGPYISNSLAHVPSHLTSNPALAACRKYKSNGAAHPAFFSRAGQPKIKFQAVPTKRPVASVAQNSVATATPSVVNTALSRSNRGMTQEMALPTARRASASHKIAR